MKEDLLQCQQRIAPYIHNTPVMSSQLIEKLVGSKLYFKCENFQRMGAFKMRGAVNAIMQLSDEQKSRGVVTHSSGNFAQALALAAQSLGVKAYIVMPTTAANVKRNAVLGYDGHILECAPTLDARESMAKEVTLKYGATFIHPSNNQHVILGQGTAALELLQAHPDLDYIFAPVGGGGLLAGTALAAHYFGANCPVIGGEPLEADDAYRSFHSGEIKSNKTTDTVADGLRTELGDLNFPIIQKHVSRIIRVKENEIICAMRLIWERMKIIVEPSSAVALAALIKERESYEAKKIGIIISGGNVDLDNLPFF